MSFYSFRFFPHHIHGSRLLTRFLHSANQLMHRLEIHFFHVRSLFFSQAYAALHPIFLSSGLCNKTLILLSILENPKADFSIDIRFLQDIILHSPSLSCHICFCFRLESILLSVPIGCPLNHLYISFLYYTIFSLCGQELIAEICYVLKKIRK